MNEVYDCSCRLVKRLQHAQERDMTEESSPNSPPSDVTTGENPIIGTGVTPSSVEFYTRCAVVVMGVIGTAANALILYALVASKQHKKHVLIFNQNALDLFSSLFLIITYAIMLYDFDLTKWYGPWLCKAVLSENFVWWGTNGSIINLGIITVERYLKVVHNIWSKKNLRRWMIYLAMAFAWISSIVSNTILAFETSDVTDGQCYPIAQWKSEVARMVFGIWYFLSYYVIILILFIFCYGRILVAVRRQAKVMEGYSAAGSSTAQARTKQFKTNVIKTMIMVSSYYAIAWLPNNIYFLLRNVGVPLAYSGGCSATMCVAFFYTCTNPFIYAVKFNPVKKVLIRLIPCKEPAEGAASTGTHSKSRNVPENH